MTPQIALLVTIIALTFILLVSDKLRMDVVALLVLGALVIAGLVTPSDALSGFSSPAVVTIWAVFILSGGLSRTGVTSLLGRQVSRLTNYGEAPLIAGIMLAAGLLSGFLNNIAVAAFLLPIVMDITRNSDYAPSKLILPLAFGSLLGGLTTLIGTPPNILTNDILVDFDLHPFRFFDFTPVGLAMMLAGITYMTLVGRHQLPTRNITKEASAPRHTNLEQVFDFHERLFLIRLPAGSELEGKSIAGTRLGAALDLNIIAVLRGDVTLLAPTPDFLLRSRDRLVVEGRLDQLEEIRGRRHLILTENQLGVENLVSGEIALAEIRLAPDASLVGKTLLQSSFRQDYGVNVLAIRNDGITWRTNLQNKILQPTDTLLIQGTHSQLDHLSQSPDFASMQALTGPEVEKNYQLKERLLTLLVPRDSVLVGRTLVESRLGDALGLTVLGIVRAEKTYLAPEPEEVLHAEDILIVEGNPGNLEVLRGLQRLGVDRNEIPHLFKLESDQVGLAEVVLSPHSTLAGKTLRELHFREKYGLSVLAIWRQGRAYRSNLRNMPLRFGDALLTYGLRNKLQVLGTEPDFLVLTEAAQVAPLIKKAPIALFIMAGILSTVILNLLPIYIAAVVGAAMMVTTGCLTMEEAYRHIEWRVVFLIAGLLPLGIAMQQTGAASFLAEGVVRLVGELGPLAVVSGLFLMTAMMSQIMPNAAVIVIMAPIALSTAVEMGFSPYPLAMTVALSASASFLSPIAHPVNALVLGPGGYRFFDFIKVGLPLTLLMLVTLLAVLPRFWPF